MKKVYELILKSDTNEEYLPGYSDDFPIISSYVELDRYPERFTPWHWHNTLELFYIKNGALDYYTPHGAITFTKGSGGLVNSDILHMTKLHPGIQNNIQYVHLFDPMFISGGKNNLIDRKYVMPLVQNSQIELLPLFSDVPEHTEVLNLIHESFQLEENELFFELYLKQKLMEIWTCLLDLFHDHIKRQYKAQQKSNVQIKQMMLYVQAHYSEKISVKQLADAAFLSERECYRIFQECLHMTPVEYIRSHRLQMACRMLTGDRMTLTQISHACGLGSSSYFGKLFKEYIGCTPLEYRRRLAES